MHSDNSSAKKQRSTCIFNTPNNCHFTEVNKLFTLKFSQNNNEQIYHFSSVLEGFARST